MKKILFVIYFLASNYCFSQSKVFSSPARLGIGNTNPDSTLQITGGGHFTGGLIIDKNITPHGTINVPMGECSYFSLTGTVISIVHQSDGDTALVVVNPSTTLTSDSYEFTNSNGRLRYTGAVTKSFHTAMTITISPVTVNEEFVLALFKNGVLITTSRILQKVANTSDMQAFAFHTMVSLATNDYIEVYIGNISSANDVNVKTLNMFALGM